MRIPTTPERVSRLERSHAASESGLDRLHLGKLPGPPVGADNSRRLLAQIFVRQHNSNVNVPAQGIKPKRYGPVGINLRTFASQENASCAIGLIQQRALRCPIK